MKRGGYLNRYTPLKRKTRLRPVNRERLARRRVKEFGRQADLCRELPCLVCGKPPPSDPAHVRSRAAGGKDSDCVSLCRLHHSEQHSIGIKTFQAKHGIDMVAEAARLAAELADE